jgi:hypothetical protein
MTDEANFASDSHALRAGLVIGLLLANGIKASLGVDDAGNYMNVITLSFELDGEPIEVDIAVLP